MNFSIFSWVSREEKLMIFIIIEYELRFSELYAYILTALYTLQPWKYFKRMIKNNIVNIHHMITWLHAPFIYIV